MAVLYSGVPILGAQNLLKSYGDRDILAGASLTVVAGERLGLVGVNGSGKTTLVRVLAGMLEPDGGEVTRGREVTLGYLAQEPKMDPASTGVQVALSGLVDWTAAMARYETASAALETATGNLDTLLAEQSRAAAEIDDMHGWDLQYQAESILGHLGIEAPEQIVGTMSGGERRRVAMARVLVSQPDIAILDEPTNHLDIATIEWLEQYLIERFTGSLVMITHDRYLLDRVVTRTVELDQGSLYSYDGGWGAYLAAKADRAAQEERVEANRRNFLRRELEWMRRQPKARSTKQKARLGRAQTVLDADGPTRDGVATLAVGATRTGKTILEAKDLAVEIGGARLVEDLTLIMRKGDRIGIVGPNGAGKTTLLRVLLGRLEPAAGTATLGKNTVVAYLDQSRAGLDDDKSIFDNVAEGRTQVTLGEQTMEMRSYLQRFLFSVPDQVRPVGSLSGGERARVALARIFRENSNLVVLDEPTNDLDATTLASLEASLLDFGGSALVVTHDRWFLDRVATSILSFEGDGRVVQVHGNYHNYLTWRERDRAEQAAAAEEAASASKAKSEKPAAAAAATASVDKTTKKLTYGERNELAGMMERIDAAESQVSAMEGELESAAFATRDYVEQAAFLERLTEARTAAETLVERWSELEARSDS